jgi:hypothetical protein
MVRGWGGEVRVVLSWISVVWIRGWTSLRLLLEKSGAWVVVVLLCGEEVV